MTMKTALIGTFLLSFIWICGGCATQTTQRRQIVESELDYLLGTQLNLKGQTVADDSKLGKLVKAYTDLTDFTGADKTTKRNAIMYHVLAHIRAYHDSNYNDLYVNVAFAETATDFAVLALGAGGAFATEATSQLLSGISAGLVGARASAQAHFLNDMSKFVVLVRMQALREKKLADIYEKMNTNCEKYPLESAAKDLQDLLEDGSIRQAVTNDAKEAVANLSTAIERATSAKELLDGFVRPTPNEDN